MKITYFVNYEDGVAKLQEYRAADAQATTLEDIQRANKESSNEKLTALVDQIFNYDEHTKIATFSGINYSGDNGFDICKNEEAHNVASQLEGLSIWGLQEDLSIDIV